MSSKSKTFATKEEATLALVPKLRFPGFRGGWIMTPIGEKIDLLSGYPFDGPEISQDSAGVRLLRGINITEGRIRHTPEIDRYYTGELEGLEKFRVHVNDLVIGMDGSKVGKNSALISSNDADALLVQRVARLRTSNPTLIQFIFQQINSTVFHSYVDKINTSSGIPHISAKQIKDFVIGFPSTSEQQKIAECLSSLDELMAAQARKVDALKTHKKGLMQQLFPLEGETQPRLRFPEFQNAGEWRRETLENLCSAKISYGIVQAGPHVPNGMPYIKSTDLNSELCLNNLARTSEAIAQKYRRSEVVPGDIVFSLRGNIGVAQILPEGIPVANLTQGTARIRTKGLSEFYYHALRSPSVNSRIQAVGKGSTFQEISLEALRNIRLFHPEPAEQQRIAECLTSLDAQITAETQKHEALKTHKKGLMQQLFPSPEEVAG